MQMLSLLKYIWSALSNAVSFSSTRFDRQHFYKSFSDKHKPRNVRAKHKKGKSEEQLHAERYPAREFHPQICTIHKQYWEKRGYVF